MIRQAALEAEEQAAAAAGGGAAAFDPGLAQLQQQLGREEAEVAAGLAAARAVRGAADPGKASQDELLRLVEQMNAETKAAAGAAAAAGARAGGPGGEVHIPGSGVTQPHALDPFTTQPNLVEETAGGGGGGDDAHAAALASVVAAGTDLADAKAASIELEVEEARPHGRRGGAGAASAERGTPSQQLAAKMVSAADGYERVREPIHSPALAPLPPPQPHQDK